MLTMIALLLLLHLLMNSQEATCTNCTPHAHANSTHKSNF
jgi:hypothetical protein